MQKLFLKLSLFFCLAQILSCTSKNGLKPQDLSQDTTLSVSTQQWTKLVNSHPNNTNYLLERAKSLVNNDRLIGLAINDYRFLCQKQPNTPEYALPYIKLLFENQQIKKSLDVLNEYIKQNPKDSEALFLLGKYKYYLNQLEDAILFLNRSLNIAGTNTEAIFYLAHSHKDRKDTVQAIRLYKKILELDPTHYHSAVQIANLYAQQKSPEAIDYYNMSLRLNEFGLDALYGRAYYYQKMGYLDEAVIDYNRLLEMNPGHVQSIYNIGYINFQNEFWRLAKIQFGKAAKLAPTYVQAWYMMGLCFEAEGNTKKAIRLYQKCLQLDSTFSNASVGLRRLED